MDKYNFRYFSFLKIELLSNKYNNKHVRFFKCCDNKNQGEQVNVNCQQKPQNYN